MASFITSNQIVHNRNGVQVSQEEIDNTKLVRYVKQSLGIPTTSKIDYPMNTSTVVSIGSNSLTSGLIVLSPANNLTPTNNTEVTEIRYADGTEVITSNNKKIYAISTTDIADGATRVAGDVKVTLVTLTGNTYTEIGATDIPTKEIIAYTPEKRLLTDVAVSNEIFTDVSTIPYSMNKITDYNNVYLVSREDTTANVLPTNTETNTDLYKNDIAIVFLESGIIEYYKYGTTWTLVSTVKHEARLSSMIKRTDNIDNAPPTAIEHPSPVEGDTSIIDTGKGVEFWEFTKIGFRLSWVVKFKITKHVSIQTVTDTSGNAN